MYSVNLIIDDWNIYSGYDACDCDENIKVFYSHSIHTFELENCVTNINELINIILDNIPDNEIGMYYTDYLVEALTTENFDIDFYGQYSEMQENANGLIELGNELKNKFSDDIEFFKANHGVSVDRTQKRIECHEIDKSK